MPLVCYTKRKSDAYLGFVVREKQANEMDQLYLIIILFCLIGRNQISAQVLTCEGDRFDIQRYKGGERFVSTISQNNYDCGCAGVNCEQIICIALQSRTDNSDKERDTCRDSNTGRLYARGTSFVRHGRDEVNLACTCPSTGPLKIKCQKPQCVIPPPPPATRSLVRVNGSCYDQHTDNWHPYNVPYVRRVIMSYAPDIIGEYRCLCNEYITRCAAVDMPCCDTRTGKFVSKNERFVTESDARLPMSCVCLGGKGRISDCQQLHDTRQIGQSQRKRKRRCLDSNTNRYYREGSKFRQIKRGEERECICKRIRNGLKIQCKPRP